MLGGVGAIGYGFGALLYGFIEWLPFGWRSLYALGIVPLAFLPTFARGLRETARFAAARRPRSRPPFGALGTIAELLRRHPRRALAIALIGLLSSAGIGPSFQFISEFLQSERGWEPGAFAALTVVFGAFAIVGNPLAGWLGDRYGRLVAGSVLALFPLASLAFFAGPRGGWRCPGRSWCSCRWRTRSACARSRPSCSRPRCAEPVRVASRCSRPSASGGPPALRRRGGASGARDRASARVAWHVSVPPRACCLVPETAGRELEDVAGS